MFLDRYYLTAEPTSVWNTSTSVTISGNKITIPDSVTNVILAVRSGGDCHWEIFKIARRGQYVDNVQNFFNPVGGISSYTEVVFSGSLIDVDLNLLDLDSSDDLTNWKQIHSVYGVTKKTIMHVEMNSTDSVLLSYTNNPSISNLSGAITTTIDETNKTLLIRTTGAEAQDLTIADGLVIHIK